MNGVGGFELGVALGFVKRVQSRIETALRANEYIIAEDDFAGINKDAVIIGEEVVAGFNIEAKAAEQRRLSIRVFAELAEELPCPASIAGSETPVP